tara:strand:- start:130 stop:408 length:279 start_codon:yes stop_codon:yes gene_type:complete
MIELTKASVTMTLWKTEFTFAKTMAAIPHSWSAKQDWHSEDFFKQVVMFIRENGVKEKFFKKEYIYFYANGYKYWTMGNAIETTRIINRAKA